MLVLDLIYECLRERPPRSLLEHKVLRHLWTFTAISYLDQLKNKFIPPGIIIVKDVKVYFTWYDTSYTRVWSTGMGPLDVIESAIDKQIKDMYGPRKYIQCFLTEIDIPISDFYPNDKNQHRVSLELLITGEIENQNTGFRLKTKLLSFQVHD